MAETLDVVILRTCATKCNMSLFLLGVGSILAGCMLKAFVTRVGKTMAQDQCDGIVEGVRAVHISLIIPMFAS
jgi:hypothetical protein